MLEASRLCRCALDDNVVLHFVLIGANLDPTGFEPLLANPREDGVEHILSKHEDWKLAVLRHREGRRNIFQLYSLLTNSVGSTIIQSGAHMSTSAGRRPPRP